MALYNLQTAAAKKKKETALPFEAPARTLAPVAKEEAPKPTAQIPQAIQTAQPLQQAPVVKRPADLQPPATVQQLPSAPTPQPPSISQVLEPLTRPPLETAKAPPAAIAPNLQGMLQPLPSLPERPQPVLPPMTGGIAKTPGLSEKLPSLQEALPSLPSLPSLQQAPTATLPSKPGMLGNPALPIKPPSRNLEPAKPLYTTEQLKNAFQPDVKFKDMLGPATITAPTAPATQAAQPTQTTPSTDTGAGISSGASRFVNFDRILAANQPAAAEMAQKAIGETVARGEKAAKGIAAAGKEFTEATQTGIPETGNRITSTGNLEYDLYTGKFAPASPSVVGQAGGFGYQKTPDISLAEAERRAAQGYTGPSYDEFFKGESYKQAQTDLQKAQEALKGMSSQEGLEAYMNQLYGTAGGTGGSRLDAALARAAGGKAFNAPQERFKNINQLMSETTQAAQTAEQAARTQAENTQKYWQQQVADTKASMESWQKAEEEKKKEEHNWKMQNDPAYREAYLKAATGYSNPYTDNSGSTLYDNPYV